jgi:hypothetical protein
MNRISTLSNIAALLSCFGIATAFWAALHEPSFAWVVLTVVALLCAVSSLILESVSVYLKHKLRKKTIVEVPQ